MDSEISAPKHRVDIEFLLDGRLWSILIRVARVLLLASKCTFLMQNTIYCFMDVDADRDGACQILLPKSMTDMHRGKKNGNFLYNLSPVFSPNTLYSVLV